MAATESAGFPTARAKILIVDDHPIVRRGLRQLIDQQPDLIVSAEASDAREALDALRGAPPDAAIVDISLRQGSGLELIKDIRTRYPNVAVLALSMHDEALYAGRALRAGARGYVMKQEPLDELLAAIRRVLGGGIHVSERVASRILSRLTGHPIAENGSPLERLTDRELEVFELLARGRTTRETAEALHLSIKTIETHRAHIKDKLGLESGLEVLRYAAIWFAGEGVRVERGLADGPQPPPGSGAAD
jgi:DNA-binding NarL/FixJ family response regulator